MRLGSLALLAALLPAFATAQELRPPPSVAPTQIIGSTASGRTVLTGTAAQGATALGLGSTNQVGFAGVVLNGGGNFVPGAIYSDSGWGFLFYPRIGGGQAAHAFFNAAGNTALMAIQDGGNVGIGVGTSIGTKLDVGGPIRPATYTVATLPTGVVGALIYVSNARKVGEASGAGTGVMAYYSNGAWRRFSDDTAVAA